MLLPPIGIFAAISLYKQGFGDIKAAKWGMTAPNGEYSMKDVLKLN